MRCGDCKAVPAPQTTTIWLKLLMGQLRKYEQEVLVFLRRWLIEEELEMPMGDSGYRIKTDDVRLETSKDRRVAVVLFKIVDSEDLFGFRIEVADDLESTDPESPYFQLPELSAQVVLINLDEAILTGLRVGPDAEGVTWVE